MKGLDFMPIFLFQSSKTLFWIALEVGRLENELSTNIQHITKKHIMNSVGGSRVGPLLALLRPASDTRSRRCCGLPLLRVRRPRTVNARVRAATAGRCAFTPTGESDAKITPARRDHRAGT